MNTRSLNAQSTVGAREKDLPAERTGLGWEFQNQLDPISGNPTLRVFSALASG